MQAGVRQQGTAVGVGEHEEQMCLPRRRDAQIIKPGQADTGSPHWALQQLAQGTTCLSQLSSYGNNPGFTFPPGLSSFLKEKKKKRSLS